ncbi:hypothetical protein NR798_12705 [Archangium gephyra]|uniref:cupin-like domain-containing protein n=1 Tax=Archangium gephyra TaxID=48 RepID=UPI0035D49990
MIAPAPASPGAPSLALPRSFWKDFTRKHWDREPVLFQGLFGGQGPSLQDIFEALVEATERTLKGELPPHRGIRFFIEHEDGPNGLPYYSILFAPSQAHLPSREDRDAHAYVERITRVLGGKRFGLVLNRTQTQHWRHWQQLHGFLASVHESSSMPLRSSDSAVFFGNYRYTPFGIHKDDLHIFYFVVEGTKRLSLWPFEALSQREELPRDPGLRQRNGIITLRDKADEERVLAQATVLEGRAGDLMYWPVSHWHRAEPTQGLSVSASLGLAVTPPEFISMAPPGEWPESVRPNEMPAGKGWRMPAALRTALRRQSRRQEMTALERERTTEWVRFLTGGTLEGAAPVAREAPLQPQEWIRATARRPIVSVPLPGGGLLVSANGHAQALAPAPTAHRRLEQLLETLNGGKPQQVEQLEQAFFHRMTGRGFSRNALRLLLDELVRWRGVERCEPPSSRRR